jgi:hypothetical protein
MNEQYSDDEIIEEIMFYIWNMIDVWESADRDTRGKLTGLTHSILAMLDGESDLPKFIVAPDPHPLDKDYHIKNGKKFYPENHQVEINCDLGGILHEMFYSKEYGKL